MKNTREEQIALINAAHDGRDIEFLLNGVEVWGDKDALEYWDFGTTFYRIKPQVFEGYLCGGRLCTECGSSRCNHAEPVKLQVINNED